MTLQGSKLGRLLSALAVLLFLGTAMPSVSARGSFGGGHGFGGGGFGGGRSFGGGRGFGGLFGGSRPSFTPAPRPSFTPAPRPSFVPTPPPVSAPSSGSFGRGGGVGNPVSNHFTPTEGGGGSFGRTGAAGSRTFTSIGSHPNAPPPAPSVNVGRPYMPALSHPYYYGGRPANAYFTGGYSDYSFGYYRHPFYAWSPWSPVFYYNPPIYMGGGYVSGGFSFFHLLLGIVFWVVVVIVLMAVFRGLSGRRLV